MDPHTSPENARRAATVLTMLIDEREKRDALAHDMDAWRGRCLFVEKWCEEQGWRLATPEESQYLEMVPIDDKEKEEEPRASGL